MNIEVEAHPAFERDGLTIKSEVGLGYLDALLGNCTIPVTTVDGIAMIPIEAGTQPGQIARVRGLGVPNGDTGERGDHLITFRVDLPHSPTQEENEILIELDELIKSKRRSSPTPHHSDGNRMTSQNILTLGGEMSETEAEWPQQQHHQQQQSSVAPSEFF